MTKDELRKILKKHTLWLTDKDGGECADLSNADLHGANLREADLRNADLSNADLCGTNLSGANLSGADLHGAILYGAILRGADLHGADLNGANFYGADLIGVNLKGADLHCAKLLNIWLYGADLSNADLRESYLQGAILYEVDLRGANLLGTNLFGVNLNKTNLNEIIVDETTLFFNISCPEEGAFVGYKKAREKIVVLEIPADAKRSSATTYKCRCSKAKVLRIENLDGTPADVDSVASDYDKDFVYKVGEIVEVKDFDENRWKGCSRGIHFFISKEMARRYQ